MLQWRKVAFAAAIAALPLMALSASAAQAAPRTTGTVATASPVSHVARASIGCGDPIFGPLLVHTSTGEKIYVTGRTKCTRSVANITIEMTLERNGRVVANRGCANGGRSSLSCTVHASCPRGSRSHWQGFSSTVVLMPPGFNPPVLRGANATPSAQIFC